MNGFCFFLSENGNIIDFPKLPKITGTACQDLTESGSETSSDLRQKNRWIPWLAAYDLTFFQQILVSLSCFFHLKGAISQRRHPNDVALEWSGVNLTCTVIGMGRLLKILRHPLFWGVPGCLPYQKKSTENQQILHNSHRWEGNTPYPYVSWLEGTHFWPILPVQERPSAKLHNITMENHHFLNGKTHYKWQFSIAFCMFTRGYHKSPTCRVHRLQCRSSLLKNKG